MRGLNFHLSMLIISEIHSAQRATPLGRLKDEIFPREKALFLNTHVLEAEAGLQRVNVFVSLASQVGNLLRVAEKNGSHISARSLQETRSHVIGDR